MKKLKNEKSLFVTLLLYLIITLIGTIVMSFPAFGYLNPVSYASILFYIFAFFNVIGYFMCREERKNYELLYFCLINILGASALFISDYTASSSSLGTGFLIYTILITINRLYYAFELKKQNNTLWILRVMTAVLILFLGILTIQNFYRNIVTLQTLMIGYYFISFGIVSLLETFILGYVSSKNFTLFINGEFGEIKESIKSKNRDENIEDLDNFVKNIKAPKKKKTRK